MKFATIIIPPFGGGWEGKKLQIILPDGRDIAQDLHIQRLEIMAASDDFTMVKMTCCAHVEAMSLYPAAFNHYHSAIEMGLLLAKAVRHSGWR